MLIPATPTYTQLIQCLQGYVTKNKKPTYIVSHVHTVAHKNTFSPSTECPQCPRQIVAETTSTGRHTQEPNG